MVRNEFSPLVGGEGRSVHGRNGVKNKGWHGIGMKTNSNCVVESMCGVGASVFPAADFAESQCS